MQAVSSARAMTNSTSPPDPRLVKAAHEFEAQMMKELLKPMTGKDALTGEDEGDGGDANTNGPLGEFASEALGQAISRQGGFGIANRIVQVLSHSGNHSETGKVTENLHVNTVLKPFK